jgi:hypothetical protein
VSSVLKQQIRVAVTNDIGADLDDQLEAAKAEVQQQEGAKAAYSTAEKLIEQLLPHLQKDLNDGRISLETASESSKWIQRAMGVCSSLHVQATHLVIAKQGAVSQTEKLLGIVKKRFDSERAKLVELEKLGVSGQDDIASAAPSAPKSIKQLRMEEAAAEAAAAEAAAAPKGQEPEAPKKKGSRGGRRAGNA